MDGFQHAAVGRVALGRAGPSRAGPAPPNSSSAGSSSSSANRAAASIVQPLVNPRRLQQRRLAPIEQADAPLHRGRRVRRRSGRSTAPVPRRPARRSAGPEPGGIQQPGASRRQLDPSGKPSSRRVPAMPAASSAVSAKPGRTAGARSTNSATAGAGMEFRPGGIVAGSAGVASGGNWYPACGEPRCTAPAARIAIPRQRPRCLFRTPAGALRSCPRSSRISIQRSL